jgi:glycosyltransferase involved in cell wall biosynthesis
LEPHVTVVLPIHNAERTLRPVILRILDLVELSPHRLRLVIVDDGSVDSSYEAACELASEYPQLSVLRHPQQRGLSAALDLVRQRFDVRELIAHDGVGPIDADELMALIAAPGGYAGAPQLARDEEPMEGRGSRRFGAVAALNSRLAQAHRSVISCHWLRFHEPPTPRRKGGTFLPLGGGDSPFTPPIGMSANTCTGALAAQ